jgi:hypothetical protein
VETNQAPIILSPIGEVNQKIPYLSGSHGHRLFRIRRRIV